MATVRPVEVLLLGTGGSHGWPAPGCTCASCKTATLTGTRRAPTSVLVDGAVLIDPHDEIAEEAHGLDEVPLVLLTRPTELPAHLPGSGPVEVVGLPAALEPYQQQQRVRVVAVSAGAVLTTGAGHRVRPVRQGDALAWDICGPRRTRLLYAPQAGLLDEPDLVLNKTPYDLVLAGLRGMPEVLAQLRRTGLVTPATDVRAVAHDHRAPLPDVLQHHLRAWGVRSCADGETLPVQRSERAMATTGRTLVLGGVRSGKSALAEQLLAANPDVTYVATGGSRADDAEWQQRVSGHRARRPTTWQTVETTDLVTCIRQATGALLIDCLGTWLTASLDRHGMWDGAPATPVEAEVQELLAAWRSSALPLVAVSNEVGSGVVPATPSGRLFRDLLGRLNTQVAAESETVLLTVAGIPLPLRVPAPPA